MHLSRCWLGLVLSLLVGLPILVACGGGAPAPAGITNAVLAKDVKGNTSGQFPPGKFKAEIYLNDKLDRTLEFTVG